MSEQDQDLPPIVQQTPAPYPTLPPTQPIPVQALPYSPPAPIYSRPGLLTGISVISIVVACLSALGSLVSGCQAGSFYMMSKMSAATSSASMSTTTITTPNGSTTTVFATPMPAGPSPNTGFIPGPTTNASTQPAGPNPLTPVEVANAVQRAQSVSGNKLTPAQTTALTTALQDPAQTLISPGMTWSPVQAANVNPDGSAYVNFNGGYIMLDLQGQITANNTMPTMPSFKVSTASCILAALDALLSIALAIFVFIAAIMVMRNSPSGRRLHLIYAVLKIPVGVLGAFGLASMYSEFYGGIVGPTMPGGAGAITAMATGYAIAFCGVGLIYPIALLIALNTRRMREYYNAVRD